MKHLSVGSPPGFDISRLRGAADLARQDAETSEWLTKRAREEFHQGGPESDEERRERNREYMRKLRAEGREGLGRAPKPAPTVCCLACGTPTRKWVRGVEQQWCPQCKGKPVAWRKKAAQARSMRVTEAL